MKPALTKRQQQVLDTIERLTNKKGMPPTFCELMEPLGIKGTNGIACHLRPLKKKGLVTWNSRQSRTLRIVPQPQDRGMPIITLEQLSA